MPAPWNSNPATYQPKVTHAVPTADALQRIIRLCGIALAAGVCARGTGLLTLVSTPQHVRLIIDLLLISVSAVSGVMALNTAYRWHTTRSAQAAQQLLADSQRKLLGLPPQPPRTGATPADAARRLGGLTPARVTVQAVGPSLSPPLRYTPTPLTTGRAAEQAGLPSATPLTGSTSLSRPSPRTGGFTVATPRQLQQYLDGLDGSAGGAGGPGFGEAGGARFTPASGFGGGAVGGGSLTSASTPGPTASASYMSPFDSGFGAASDPLSPAAFLQADAADVTTSPAMPYGVALPTYRPSWLPRMTGSAAASAQGEVVEAASEQEATDFLWAVMRVRRAWLETWTERLREWFASYLLQPLVDAADTAHAVPNGVLAKYGQGARLPPLSSLLGAGATGGNSGGGARGAGAADVEQLLRHAAQFAAAMAAAPAPPNNPGQPADARALGESVVRYEQLLLVLQGRRPAELLPPSPPGYIAARVRQLSRGTCVPDFNWNGGSAWGGRPWSPDLPTDSQLLLYLFAAFIDAPGWEFSTVWMPGAAPAAAPAGASISGGGVGGPGAGLPLFLGVGPTARAPQQYTAILAYRLEKPGKGVDAIYMLHPGQSGGGGPGGAAPALLAAPGATSMFCMLAEARLLALTGYNALFHVLLAFLAFHKTKLNSALGNHYLQDPALGLAQVIEVPRPGEDASPAHSVFGWWFPPRGLGRRVMTQQQPHIFTCSLCGFSVPFQHKGQQLPPSGATQQGPAAVAAGGVQQVWLEPVYLVVRHVHPVALGADCSVCGTAVCLDEACSLFFGKRFCARCAKRHQHLFPPQLIKAAAKSFGSGLGGSGGAAP